MPPVRPHDEYKLYVCLAEIEPAIWRRIVVPGQMTLHQLHHILQVTMGWTHAHLHQFIVPGTNESTYYGEPSPEDDYFHKDDRRSFSIWEGLAGKAAGSLVSSTEGVCDLDAGIETVGSALSSCGGRDTSAVGIV